MNRREKEQYLREYSVLKEQGKSFFPYAVLKDSVMAVIVLVVIMMMAIVLGAELGPKADPTTTSYTPRPEWYFYFLFELLRIIKPPSLVIVATIGIPTVALILLLLLPFYDRSSERHPGRRPVATAAGLLTIFAMAYLTYLGATAQAPDRIDLTKDPNLVKGQEVANQSGCAACHKFGEAGNDGPGLELTHIGKELPASAIRRSLSLPIPPMPSYSGLSKEKTDALVDFLVSLR